MPSDELSVESDAPSSSVALSSNTMARHVEIGRTIKVKQLRDDAVAVLEEMLATKMEEVGILQEQLALLSKQHVREAAMVDPYGDSGIFTGQINNEKPHGKGTSSHPLPASSVLLGVCYLILCRPSPYITQQEL